MGTAGTVPGWVGEIMIMEQMGWTERELFEEVSLGTIQRINYLNELRAKAEQVRKMQQPSMLSSSRRVLHS